MSKNRGKKLVLCSQVSAACRAAFRWCPHNKPHERVTKGYPIQSFCTQWSDCTETEKHIRCICPKGKKK